MTIDCVKCPQLGNLTASYHLSNINRYADNLLAQSIDAGYGNSTYFVYDPETAYHILTVCEACSAVISALAKMVKPTNDQLGNLPRILSLSNRPI